jgi:hypothetical protein
MKLQISKHEHTSANSGSRLGSTPNSKLLPPPAVNPAGTPSSPAIIGDVINISLRICGPGGIGTR